MSYEERLWEIIDEYYESEWYDDLDMRTNLMIIMLKEEFNK